MAATTRDLISGYPPPPESTQLHIGDDVAWSDVNGVYDRDDSLKENTNPKCLLNNNKAHPHHAAGAPSSSSSQRFSIIGLPGKLGQQGGGGGGARRSHPPPAIFPKKARTGGGGRQAKPAVPEPGSPKVSCFGKVRSDRERSFRRRPASPSPPPSGPTTIPTGCCGGFFGGLLLMRRSRSRNSAVECVDQSPPPPPATLPPAARRWEPKETEMEVPAPGLGGVRRFSSGRRAADWADEMEEDGRVARSGPL